MDPTILSTRPANGPSGDGLRIIALAVVVLIVAIVATFLLVVIFATVDGVVGDGSSAEAPAILVDLFPRDGPSPLGTDATLTCDGDEER